MPHTTQTTNTIGTLATLRALVPKRRLTNSEVRQVVERQANTFRRQLDITEDRFPVEALNELPRVELRTDHDQPGSAMALWDGRTWVILVNTNDALSRQRFSVLHELHHIICHTTKRQMFGTDDMRNADAEVAADYFAACVLMPKLLVKRYWGQGPRTVTAMSARFGVSRQAMSYRLDQLGLTERRKRCSWTAPTSPVNDEIAVDDFALEAA